MTRSAEFNVLSWNLSFDGPWSPEAAEKYVRGGYDGLALVPSRTTKPADLEFVRRLPGLRSLEVPVRMSNDVAAFAIETLERLALMTGSRRRVPAGTRQPALRSLGLTARPGLDDVGATWPALEWLRLDFYPGTDLRLMGEARSLRELRISGRRQSAVLDGIEAATALQRLVLTEHAVVDSAPIRALRDLHELRLVSMPPGPPHGRIRFSDLVDAPLEKIWIAHVSELSDLEAVASLERLRELRLGHCHLGDADRAILEAVPTRVRVELVDCT